MKPIAPRKALLAAHNHEIERKIISDGNRNTYFKYVKSITKLKIDIPALKLEDGGHASSDYARWSSYT